MNDLFKKIKFFYITATNREETYKRRGIKPKEDWAIILVSSFTVFCILVVFAIYFYIQIKNDKLFLIAEVGMTEEEEINVDLLKKTVDSIKHREEITNTLNDKGVNSSDPSL